MAVSVKIPGTNGAGDEVFEAETHEALVAKLAEAKGNATRKIAEQQAAISEYESKVYAAPQPVNTTPVPDNQFDRQRYFNSLYDDPLVATRYALKHILGRDPEEAFKDYEQIRQGALLGQQQATNAAFVQKHPELLQVTQAEDQENAHTISKIITDNGWAYTLNNLEAAYAVAKTSNRLKLPQAASTTPPVPEPVVPTTVSTPAATGTDAARQEEEFLRTAPMDKVRDYLERKYAGQPIFAPTTL